MLQGFCLNNPGPYLPRIADALVAALSHESAFCVAAAAGALRGIGDHKSVGQKLMEESGAVPALIGVIKADIQPVATENKTALYRRYAHKLGMFVCLGMYVVAVLYVHDGSLCSDTRLRVDA